MQITISEKELCGILSDRLGCNVTSVKVISTVNGADILRPLRDAVESLRYGSDQKILAIKTFREQIAKLPTELLIVDERGILYDNSLANAKHIIENWMVFRNFVLDHNRLPRGNCFNFGMQ